MTKAELIAALEKTTGPDRQLDYAIVQCIGSKVIPFDVLAGRISDFVHVVPNGIVRDHVVDELPYIYGGTQYLPRFTASRDAMLPGAERLRWTIIQDVNGHWLAWAEGFEGGNGKTEPLARRIAEIKALVKD